MKMMDLHHINMFNDKLFKSFIKSEEARGIIAPFLSIVTGINEELLKNATYISEELTLEQLKEKKKTTDIIIRADENNRIVLELNQDYSKHIFEKNTQYSWNISNITTKSQKIYSQVILINIDKFNYYKTDKPILHFKLRDQYGNIEHELYNSIHLIVENINERYYNVSKGIEKFISFLLMKDIDDMKDSYKEDDEYMAGIVKIEDMMRDVDKEGLLYDYEEEMESRIQGSYEYGVEQGVEQKTKESAINLYKNGASKELIIKSLNITEEVLEDYLK